jgi:DNA polymerase epsilon subunit 2
MRRQCLLPPCDDAGGSSAALFGHLALTVLQQSHLCPLPLVQQPVYWQLDHALHLYPLPHALVLGDASPQAMHRHAGCLVINPGQLSEGLFACYVPAQDEVEMSAVPGVVEEEAAQEEEAAEEEQQVRQAQGQELDDEDMADV